MDGLAPYHFFVILIGFLVFFGHAKYQLVFHMFVLSWYLLARKNEVKEKSASIYPYRLFNIYLQ